MLKTMSQSRQEPAKPSISETPATQPRRTVFHEPWWLDITNDDSYRETVVSSGGHVVGRLPYRIRKTVAGFTIVDMPLLVHTLGPIVAPQFAGENFPKSLKEFSIVSDLIAQLPKASHISFRLHRGSTNTLAFEAAGFSTDCSFTVEIPPTPAPLLWSQMRDKTRNVIRRAQECLTISTMTDVDLFLKFYEYNLQTRGRKNVYQHDMCSRLLTECIKRNAGRIIAAKDGFGQMQAAVFTVWDTETEYYFMATRSHQSVNGANSLLIWDALQHASSLGLTFDMDGLHVVDGKVPNLLLLTGFGGHMKPRFQVQKSSPALHVAKCLRELWKN